MGAIGELTTQQTEVRAPRAGRGARWATHTSRGLLAYALVASIVPISPVMPSSGLDPSWGLAVNRATAEGMQFGQDIVFTYGPYAGVLTRMYEPGIRLLTVVAALVLAAGCLAATFLALRRSGIGTHLGAAVAVILLTAANLDVLVLVYPLVVVFAVTDLPDRPPVRAALLVLMAAPMGILPIAKLSLLPAVVTALVAAITLLIRRSDRTGSGILLLVPLVSLVSWWLAAKQSIWGLPAYLPASWDLVTGYSEAMSFPDHSRLQPGVVTTMYLTLSMLIVIVAGTAARRGAEHLVLAVTTGLTLFLVLKTGFVRADRHMEAGALALLAAGALVLTRHDGRLVWRRTIAGAVIAGATLSYLATTRTSPAVAVHDRTSGLVSDVVHGKTTPTALHRRYDAAMASIRERFPVPEVVGPSDLYPASLALLLAQGADWDPRPVIQSYAAFTPELAAMNARHLTGDDAPETVLFRIDPIDRRLAALEDGASWLPLLENYEVVTQTSGYLALSRRSSPRSLTIGADTTRLDGRLGRSLAIPAASSAWLASVDLAPTLAGKVRNLIWKQPQLSIEVRAADGKTAVRRFVPMMARSEFVLSPYVSDTAGLRSLFPGQPGLPPGSEVTSIRLVAHGPAARHFWNESFSLRLRSLDVTP